MTAKQVQEAIDKYRVLFEEFKVGKVDYPHYMPLDSAKHALEHCHGMLDQMETFLKEGRMEKVFRRLGFIQGILWREQFYTMEDLKDHNRSEKSLKN